MNRRLFPSLCALAAAACMCKVATAQFEETATGETKAPAVSQLLTGADLYKHRGQKDWIRAYVAGVIDASSSEAHPKYCLPEEGTLDDYTEVVVGYLAANPQIRNEPGSVLVRDSLGTAFSCSAVQASRQ